MTSSYSADQIQVLEGLEPVRMRPGMYIGTTGPRGLHHLVYEVVDNSIDEALAGHCTHIEVDLNADGSVAVTDDGRGIPTDVHPQTGRSALETVMTVLHAGGKFGGGGYKVSGGLHGVGISVVNALSEFVEATVWRDKRVFKQRFERGIPIGELKSQPNKEAKTGTSITFKPDADIFTVGTEFDYITLSGRLRELAYITGSPISEQQGENPPSYPILQIGLDCPNLEDLQKRIEQRTEEMISMGLVAEVELLCQKYGVDLPLLNTLGYQEIKEYLLGNISLSEAKNLTVLHTRQFAKRQRTWFRAYKEIEWFDAEDSELVEKVWQRVQEFMK